MKLLTITSLLLTLASSLSAQILKPKMQVNIQISGVPTSEVTRISSTYVLDSKGFIRLPLLEGVKVKASGLSNDVLAQRLSKAYKDAELFSSPIFTVTTFRDQDSISKIKDRETAAIVQARQDAEELKRARKVVYITGPSISVGKVPHFKGITFSQLLAQVGGARGFASKRKFSLTRNKVTYNYNYKKDPSKKDLILQKGDQIVIPESGIFW